MMPKTLKIVVGCGLITVVCLLLAAAAVIFSRPVSAESVSANTVVSDLRYNIFDGEVSASFVVHIKDAADEQGFYIRRVHFHNFEEESRDCTRDFYNDYDRAAERRNAGRYEIKFDDKYEKLCVLVELKQGGKQIFYRDVHGLTVGAIDSGSVLTPVASSNTDQACGGSGRYLLGIPSWDRGLGDCEQIEGEEILSGEKVTLIVNNILAILTHLAAFVAVGFIIYGGFKYVLSTGNADQATEARKTIINAGIGAVIVIMARVLTEIIHNNLTGG